MTLSRIVDTTTENLFATLHRSLLPPSTAISHRYFVKEKKTIPNTNLLKDDTPIDIVNYYLSTNLRSQFVGSIATKYAQIIKRRSLTASHNIFHISLRKIQQQQQQQQFIIKPSDKNLGICVVSPSWYRSQIWKHLLSPTYEDITQSSVYLIASAAEALRKMVNSVSMSFTLRKFLLQHISCPCASQFYVLPKVHKVPISSRPITADHSSLCNPASRVLAGIFNSLIGNFPNILKNSFELAKMLDNTSYPQGKILITLDVESLYPNMSEIHVRAMKIVLKKFLTQAQVDESILPIDDVLKFFDFILKNHFVKFDGKVFRQINGVAMGTPLAPPFANIALAYLENSVISKYSTHISFYKRYIDDIVILWNDTPELLNLFVKDLATALHVTLNVTSQGTSVDFLDLNIFMGPRFTSSCILEYRTAQKALNNYLYLPPRSNHPRHNFTGMIFGEIKRYSRTNSSPEEFYKLLNKFVSRLQARGFPNKVISCVLGPKTERASLYQRLRQPGPSLTLTESKTKPLYHVYEYWSDLAQDMNKEILSKLRLNASLACTLMPSLGKTLITSDAK